MLNNYWVTFANTPFDSRRLGVNRLGYPLSMHIPESAFSNDNSVGVSKKSDLFEIGIELAVTLNRDLFKEGVPKILAAIESYHLVLSATNDYHLKGIRSRVVEPSAQDEADSEYFTRWWENSNALSQPIDCSWAELKDRDVELYGDGIHASGKIDYYHSPVEIAHFLCQFTQIYAGTCICMGHLFRVELETQIADRLTVCAGIPGLNVHEVTLCLVD